MAKVLIIGLDSARPEAIFGEFAPFLPNLCAMGKEGFFGPLLSTDPPITIPAWPAMVTGKDPGELGIYGFRNRESYDYSPLGVIDSHKIRQRAIWNWASINRKNSIILNVPGFWPPMPLRGIMISPFMAPDSQDYGWPSGIEKEIEAKVGGSLREIQDFRFEEPGVLLDSIRALAQRRFLAFETLLAENHWDFAMMVDMGIDRLQHIFWGSPWVIRDYYALMDKLIGELLAKIDMENTHIFIVSDHGARKMEGCFHINQWLLEKGFLALKEKPRGPTLLRENMIDFSKTSIWASGGYYSRIFFNIRGREPRGTVGADKALELEERLRVALNEISFGDCQTGINCDESSKFGFDDCQTGIDWGESSKLGFDDCQTGIDWGESSKLGFRDCQTGKNILLKPREIYRELNNIPPDLLLYPANLSFRAGGKVGGKVFTMENDQGPDGANHDPFGMVIFRPQGGNIGNLDMGKMVSKNRANWAVGWENRIKESWANREYCESAWAKRKGENPGDWQTGTGKISENPGDWQTGTGKISENPGDWQTGIEKKIKGQFIRGLSILDIAPLVLDLLKING